MEDARHLPGHWRDYIAWARYGPPQPHNAPAFCPECLQVDLVCASARSLNFKPIGRPEKTVMVAYGCRCDFCARWGGIRLGEVKDGQKK